MRLTFTARALSSVALVLAAACHDASAPPPAGPFDPAQAKAAFEPLAAVFDQPIFASFDAALSFYEAYFRTTLPAAATMAPRLSSVGPGPTTSLSPFISVGATRIPDDVKGKTFVYDPTSHSYVVDPAGAGAPATGVRFILYKWMSGTGGPASPLTRIGYVDIAEEPGHPASAQYVDLSIISDAPHATVSEFVITHITDAAGVVTFGVHGTATDGTTDVTVSLGGTSSGAEGQHHLTYSTTLASLERGVSSFQELVYDQATASQGGRVELNFGGHELRDDPAASGGGRELKFDEQPYATVVLPGTTGGELQFLKPDGTPLPQAEVANVEALFLRIGVASFYWNNIAFP